MSYMTSMTSYFSLQLLCKAGYLRFQACRLSVRLKGVNVEEKLLEWRAYRPRNSPILVRSIDLPTPTPTASKIGGSQPQPQNLKIQWLLSQERVKLRTSTLARTFSGSIRTKSIKNFGEKGAWAYPGTAQFFWIPQLSQEQVKLRTSNLAGTFTGTIQTKAD